MAREGRFQHDWRRKTQAAHQAHVQPGAGAAGAPGPGRTEDDRQAIVDSLALTLSDHRVTNFNSPGRRYCFHFIHFEISYQGYNFASLGGIPMVRDLVLLLLLAASAVTLMIHGRQLQPKADSHIAGL